MGQGVHRQNTPTALWLVLDDVNGDSPIISDLMRDEPEYIELIKRYVNELSDIVHNIEEAFQGSNWQHLKFLIHDLKGSSGNYGYDELYRLCMEIEAKIESQDYDAVELLISELGRLCGLIKRGMVIALE